MKIYDCFIFNGENSILEIRLNELDNIVDYFVIIEFGETFTGIKKEKKINQNLLNKFRKKSDIFINTNLSEINP